MADQQYPLAGGFPKRHVSSMLKHLEDEEQKSRAVEVAAAYKMMFAEKTWDPVLANLKEFAAEDHLRLVRRRRPAPLKLYVRPIPTTNASALPAMLLDGQSQTTHPPQFNTASSLLSTGRARAPSTPRERWDVLSRGPATPLTPTPTGNAFAGGGFWESLTPKTPALQTPITSTPYSPYSPIVPRDSEAQAAYNHVKHEIDTMSRNICANRMRTHSRITDSDDIPKNLITPKDHLKAAAVTLQYRQVDLQSTIDPELPKKLQQLATEEAKIMLQYSVRNMLELLDIDTWLRIDEQTLVFTTLLDAQRELLHMHRHRRKSSIIKLPEHAIQVAWAVRILEDAERAAENNDDGESNHSNEDKDQGYEYSNFMRSIKPEVTSSSSDLSSLADINSLRSTMSFGESLRALRREQSLDSQRSSISPQKSIGDNLRRMSRDPSTVSPRRSTSPNKPNKLSLRSRTQSGIPDSPLRDQSHKSSRSLEKFSNSIMCSRHSIRSDNSSLGKKTTNASTQSRLFSINTNVEQDKYHDLAPLSPEDRAFRRKRASKTALNSWATQLKQMEEQRNAKISAQRRKSRQLNHLAFCGTEDKRGRDPSTGSAESWMCDNASSHGRKTSLKSQQPQSRRNLSPFNPSSINSMLRHSDAHQTNSNTTLSSLHETHSSIIHSPCPPSPALSSHRSSLPSPMRPSFEYDLILRHPPSAQSGYRYQHPQYIPATSQCKTSPPHDTVRRRQHVRSKSSPVRVEGDEEGVRADELRRMQSRESSRQTGRSKEEK